MITEVLKYIISQKKKAMLNKENLPLLPHEFKNTCQERL